ncbi:MAG: exodeoxyribonuclease V subunit gamma [Pirellulales bacterium]|nr:exodeoxyribonuclease V subunit gamma [Pirellulales bacterium]
MPARLTILCGPARCGKTKQLLALYRDALRRRPPGAAIWLAPTGRAAAEVRDRLLDEDVGGCLSPGATTFDKFAVAVLRKAGKPIRLVAPPMKRELLRRIIDVQAARGRLNHFRPIVETAGMLDLVCEFIGELKRLEIWPETFLDACKKRGLTDKDREFHEIYDQYQQTLREHCEYELYDKEGRLWSARDELSKVATDQNPLPSLLSLLPSIVVADGFTDFTSTQYEILDSLAVQAEEMYVSLPLEAEPRRGDLFSKPLKTLAELRRRRPDAAVEQLGRPERPAWPAMAHLERTLFECPRSESRLAASGTEPPTEGVEILAAARQIGEIEAIAARIKRLIIERNVPPDDVAVVFRRAQEPADLIREVFGRLQIPFALETGRPLERQPALRALVKLLQLDLEDWPFDLLLSVVGSNYFRPDWPEWMHVGAAELERAVRALQIPRGRERLIEQAKSPVVDVFKRLARALDALPQRATLSEWGKAWERLAEETGLLGVINEERKEREEGSGADDSLSDQDAWRRFMAIIADGARLAGWLRRAQPELDRRAARETLIDILGGEPSERPHNASGRVRVLSAQNVRSLSVPHLFLAGLSEKVFPPPDREDRLYGEAEYVRLKESGLPLSARRERTRDEMLLFYEAVTRAAERLYLSYPALDEAAQPLLPSPFLDEVERAFSPAKVPRVEQTDLSPVPRGDEPLSAAEFRVKAVAAALEGNVALLAGWFSWDEGRGARGEGHALDVRSSPRASLASPLAAGLRLIYSRQDRERFGPAEGVLQGGAVRARLADEFSPQRTFAATELERYAYCPFQFFMERILKIEPVEDLTLEFDVLNRGRIAHEVLSRFHRAVNARLGRPGSPLELDGAEFDALMAEAIAESLPPEPGNPLRAAMREIDRRLVVEWMAQYRQQTKRYDDQWKGFDAPPAPELFEVSFGQHSDAVQPLEFHCGKETVRVAGRIDRLDVGAIAGRTVFNVLDYKTGGSIRFNPESIRSGTTLQLPLYALAAAELLLDDRGALPWRAGYWYVREAGYKPRQALRMYAVEDGRIELDPDWEQIRAGLGDTVAALVSAFRRGAFPVCCGDDRCTGRCPYHTVCRVNHVRALEKTCRPTAND